MQPLSRVKPNAVLIVGQADTMQKRPKLAAQIAECIAEFSNLETMLPVTLAFLLSADAETTITMWFSLENRTAQLRLLDSAAEQVLSEDHLDCWSVLSMRFVRSAMKERDKLAHWTWGYSDDLPEALLLVDPVTKAKAQLAATDMTKPPNSQQIDRTGVFVVTGADLTRTFKRMDEAAALLELFMRSIWPSVSDQEYREQYHQQLRNEPRFSLLLADHMARKNGQPEHSPFLREVLGG